MGKMKKIVQQMMARSFQNMLIVKFLSENGKNEDGCIANDGIEIIKRAFVVMYTDGIGCLSTSHRKRFIFISSPR